MSSQWNRTPEWSSIEKVCKAKSYCSNRRSFSATNYFCQLMSSALGAGRQMRSICPVQVWSCGMVRANSWFDIEYALQRDTNLSLLYSISSSVNLKHWIFMTLWSTPQAVRQAFCTQTTPEGLVEVWRQIIPINSWKYKVSHALTFETTDYI